MINANAPVVVVELDHNPLGAFTNLHTEVTALTVVLEGTDGKSAYEVAVAEGFVGTESEWLLSLNGTYIGTEAPIDTSKLWIDPDDATVQAGWEVASITALRLVTPTTRLYVSCHTTIGDGGHGYFNYTTSNTPGKYVDDNGYTIVPTGGDGSAAWLREASNEVNVRHYGIIPGVTVDPVYNSTMLENVKAIAVGKVPHKPIYAPGGVYRFALPFVVDNNTDPTDSNDHRNFILRGDGGLGNETSTEFQFNINDATKNAVEIISSFGVRFQDIAISTTTPTKNVLYIGAAVEPNLSGSLITFENCYFSSRTVTPAEAVINTINNKLVIFTKCWLGVNSTGGADQYSMLVGGPKAENEDFLQQGEMNCLKVEDCFIFGVIGIKRAANFVIDNNTFVEGYGSRIDYVGEGNLNSGRISGNYFAEYNTGTTQRTAITLSSYTNLGGEDTGCITITNNRFRYRPVGISTNAQRTVIIEGNHFRRLDSNSIGIHVLADAKNLTIGNNDFTDFQGAGGKSIVDLRHDDYALEPTVGVSSDIVADFVLPADYLGIGGTNNTQLIGQVDNIFLRGGKYRIRVHVSVRNLDPIQSLPVNFRLKYRERTGTIRSLGILGSFTVPPDDASIIPGANSGSGYLERIVYLKATPSSELSQSSFLLYVRNLSGGVIPASGAVNGATQEMDDYYATWFQVEEYRD